MHRFRLYDLEISSPWRLPGAISPVAAEAEVLIRSATVPATLEGATQAGVCCQARPGEVLAWLDGVARFHIAGGCRIDLEAAPGAEAAASALLGSSPLVALLLQRGILPLQGSAVATSRGAVLFLGGAGVGKSTLAAELARRGCDVLADDVAGVSLAEDGTSVVRRGGTALRLWPEALAAVGLDGDFPRVRTELARRMVEFPPSIGGGAVPLAAIHVLWQGRAGAKTPAISPLAGAERLAAVHDLVARPEFVRGLGVERTVFAQAARLAGQIRMVRLDLPAQRPEPQRVADAVMEDLGL